MIQSSSVVGIVMVIIVIHLIVGFGFMIVKLSGPSEEEEE